MIIGIPAEQCANECRVAVSPQSVKKLQKLGFTVNIERGCGMRAHFTDEAFAKAGATLVDADEIWSSSSVVVKVDPPTPEEISRMRSDQILISFIWPAKNKDTVDALRKQGVTAMAMDCVPRISRAQKLDALSSMANIAGYRAVIEAANEFGSFFTGQITAAGKVPPAKVLVIGAGVAGLSAIGAAKSLGAIVRAFDTRLAAKDQVKSMGAEFLELKFEESGEGAGGYAKVMSDEFIKAEMELFADQAKEVDVIVTTALIPNKPAPKLITDEMVRSMRDGSVIVDLAAENGGNCELTEPGKSVVKHGVTIIGYTDFPSRLPTQSSSLYANNLVNLLSDMKDKESGQIKIDTEDEVVRGCLVTHNGEVMWPPPAVEPPPAPAKPPPHEDVEPVAKSVEHSALRKSIPWILMVLAAVFMLWLGEKTPIKFVNHMTVFVLACFVGWQVVWNVTPALHTPLMSVTNAISGIIVIGAMLQIGHGWSWATALGALAVLIAAINIFGGFLVTQRMLGMFRKED